MSFQGFSQKVSFAELMDIIEIDSIICSRRREIEKMKKFIRETGAYVFGFIVFVVLLPLIMWLAAGRSEITGAALVMLCIFGAAGIGISLWSIIYMRLVGKGNPFDAYGHELAPRTKHLITGGPYRLCRNPMMTGMLIYWVTLQLVLLSWKACLVFVAVMIAMAFQIRSEEKRLETDFGEEYAEYKSRTFRFIPIRKG